jgi:hypothetical protein
MNTTFQDRRVGLVAGESFKIRLLPREVMVCVAITKMVAGDIPNLSLAQAIRIAITELCEAAVQAGLVAEPDEFAYLDTTASYRRSPVQHKMQTSRLVMRGQMERVSAGLSAAFSGGKLRLMPQGDGQGPDGHTRPPTADELAAHHERLVAQVEASDGRAAAEKLRKSLRVDPRRLRYDELKFRSTQDPENMSPAEMKEMRRLQKELA